MISNFDVNRQREDGRIGRPFEFVAIGIAVVALFAGLNSVIVIAAGWLLLAGVFVVVALVYRPRDRPALALVVVLAITIATPVTRLPGVTSLLLLAFVVVVTVPTVVGAVSYGASRPLRGAVTLSIMLSTVAISTVTAGSVESLFRFAAVVAVPVVCCYLLAIRLDGKNRHVASLVVVALGVSQALVALAEVFVVRRRFGPPAQLDDQGAVKMLANELVPAFGERAQGTLGHPLVLAFLLSICVGLVLRLPSLQPALRWTTVGVLMVGIVLSGSRSALIFAVLLIAFVPAGRVTFARVIAASLGSALCILLLVSGGFALGAILDDVSGTGSYTHRLGAVDAAGRLWEMQDVSATFLGNGYGSTGRLFAEGLLQSDGFEAVDNQFVLLLAQGGVIAFLAFAAFCVMGVTRGRWQLRAAVIVVTLNSLVFDWMNWPCPAALGFFVLGAALSSDRSELTQVESDFDAVHPVVVPTATDIEITRLAVTQRRSSDRSPDESAVANVALREG